MSQKTRVIRYELLECRRMMSANPVLSPGTIYLEPNEAGQAVDVYIAPGDTPLEVQGLNFNAQVADGGPVLGGSVDGPAIRDIDIESGIFSGNHTGQVDPEPQPDPYAQWEGRFIVTDYGTVTADGLLAVLTFDTTGYVAGSWPLVMDDANLNGSTDFAGLPINITNGTLVINDTPDAIADAYAANEDTDLVVGVSESLLANDVDLDDPLSALTAVKDSDPTKGALVAFNSDGTFTYRPNADFTGTDSFTYHVTDGKTSGHSTMVTITVQSVGNILGRHVAYNDSYWDGNNLGVDASDLTAIATDKVPLFVSEMATFANVTNYSKGINEIIIVVDNVANAGRIDAYDFTFAVGNDDTPNNWTPAPGPREVVVREDAGTNGEDTIHIIWNNDDIKGEWLQVNVLPGTDVGVDTTDTFFYGNAPGDTGNSPTDTIVNATDVEAIRSNKDSKTQVSIENVWDIDRDSYVLAVDMVLAKSHATISANDLNFITPTEIVAPLVSQAGLDVTGQPFHNKIVVPSNEYEPDRANIIIYDLDQSPVVDDGQSMQIPMLPITARRAEWDDRESTVDSIYQSLAEGVL